MSFDASYWSAFAILCACVVIVVFGAGRLIDSMWDADHAPADKPFLSLATRKKLAAPLYWLAGKFLTWANWVDGPQPRKLKS